MFKHDQWVRPDLKRYRGLLVWSLILGVLTFVCAGALMFTSGFLIDKSATKPLFAAIYVVVVLTRGFGIGRPVFQYVERLTSHNWVLRVTSHMRKKLYTVLETDAPFVQEHHQTGDILNLLADDIGHLQNLYLRTVFPTVVAGLVSIVATLLLGWFDWGFALWILLLLAAQVVLLPWWSFMMERRQQRQQKQLSNDAYVGMTDAVLGLSDWVIGQRQDAFLTTATQSAQALAASKQKSRRFGFSRDFWLQVIFLLLPLSLLVWTNLYWTGSQTLANWVGAFVLVVFPLNQAFNGVSQGVSELPGYEDSIQHLNSLAPVVRQLPAQLPAPDTIDQLQLTDVHFQYDANSERLLNGINLTLKAGDKVALLGPSGMGKTTLLQLILGDLTPTSGQVALNGTDVLAYQAHRAQIFAVLDQKPFLFQTSIANNVRLGNEAATDDEILAALEAVQLGSLIARLPQGINTPMAEAGFGFSGGEQQRLALARILLQQAPIVLLDEPTVGLDPQTEQALIETIFTVLADRTVLWITHHLQGVQHVDRVLFLEDGQLAMDGTPAALYAENSRYRHLYALDAGKE